MTEKKYYWLKLYDDFFSMVQMKKLRRMPEGDTCVIIYLRLLQLAMKNEGMLEWKGLEDSFAEELALTLDEDAELVGRTLSFLKKTELAEEIDGDRLLLPYAVQCTGSEGTSGARMRELKLRQQLNKLESAESRNDNSGAVGVTLYAKCNGDTKEEVIEEIDTTTITRDKSAAAEDAVVVAVVGEDSHTPKGTVAEELRGVLNRARDAGFPDNKATMNLLIQLFDQYGREKMVDGIDACVDHSKPTIAYLKGCLAYMSGEKSREMDKNPFTRMLMEEYPILRIRPEEVHKTGKTLEEYLADFDSEEQKEYKEYYKDMLKSTKSKYDDMALVEKNGKMVWVPFDSPEAVADRKNREEKQKAKG